MRNYKSVDNFIFGQGVYAQLPNIIAKLKNEQDDFAVFLVDDVFKTKPLGSNIPLANNDKLIWINVADEPKTKYVDAYVEEIKGYYGGKMPVSVVGIGGGSVMDYAKAISLMLNTPGSSSQYQGLDLINKPGVHCTVVPTISGTGAEVSMTAVLTGPEKKLGIKCDYTVPNQLVLDPDLTAGVPKNQWFYTGMDCYIHAVEALTGHCINEFGTAFGQKSLELCHEVFLSDNLTETQRAEKLMIASYMGGLSLTYSQVGVCHALSYGLSYVLGTHHGLANCIAFNHLEEYYGDAVLKFHEIVKKHNIDLPKGVCANLTDAQLDQMVETSYALDHMWLHAFGNNWQDKLTREVLKDLFLKM